MKETLEKGSWWIGPENRIVKVLSNYVNSDHSYNIKVVINDKVFFAVVRNNTWFYKTHKRIDEITDPKKKAWALLKVEHYESNQVL